MGTVTGAPAQVRSQLGAPKDGTGQRALLSLLETRPAQIEGSLVPKHALYAAVPVVVGTHPSHYGRERIQPRAILSARPMARSMETWSARAS